MNRNNGCHSEPKAKNPVNAGILRLSPQDDTSKIKLALTLNALVLPGLGYFFIGKKLKGALVIAATLFVFAAAMVEFGAAFAHSMQFSVIDALGTAWMLTKTRIFIYIGILLLLWIYGILDVLIFKRNSRL